MFQKVDFKTEKSKDNLFSLQPQSNPTDCYLDDITAVGCRHKVEWHSVLLGKVEAHLRRVVVDCKRTVNCHQWLYITQAADTCRHMDIDRQILPIHVYANLKTAIQQRTAYTTIDFVGGAQAGYLWSVLAEFLEPVRKVFIRHFPSDVENLDALICKSKSD